MKLFAFNMGSVDRVVRLLLGVAILSLALVGPRTPWGWLGLILIVTAVVGVCPIYGMLGISTKPAAES